MVPIARRKSLKPVSSNIRHYLKNAILPRMKLASGTPRPPKHLHLSHNIRLHGIRAERYRRLKRILRLDADDMDKKVFDFVERHMPSQPITIPDIEDQSMTELYMPCEGYDVAATTFLPLSHVSDMISCWLPTVLYTAQRILHIIPEYTDEIKDYQFVRSNPAHDDDSNDFQYMTWGKTSNELVGPEAELDVKFIVAVMPVWSLSPHDIQRFIWTNVLPAYNNEMGVDQPPYNGAHRMWGKIYDICKQNGCHHFAVTNYHDWIFGGFSPEFEYGFVTSMKITIVDKEVPQRSPTMLEYLVYWLASSMLLEDHFEFPTVLENLSLAAIQSEDVDYRLPTPPLSDGPSESSWSRNNMELDQSEFGSSAGVYTGMITETGEDAMVAMNENWQQHATKGIAQSKRSRVRKWQQSLEDTDADVPPTPLVLSRFASPARSDYSELSSATIVPYHGQAFSTMEPVAEAEEDPINTLDLNIADSRYFEDPAILADR